MSSQRYERVSIARCSAYRCFLKPLRTILKVLVQVNAQDDDDAPPSIAQQHTPSSPPPSFRSRSVSPSSRHLLRDDPLHRNSTDQTLADAFDDSGSEAGDEPDDRQRLMRAQPDPWSGTDPNHTSPAETAGAGAGAASSFGANNDVQTQSNPAPTRAPTRALQRSSTILPFFGGTSSSNSNRHISSSNDGVFANLAAKPERGEKNEDMPPVSLVRSTLVNGF